jgi:hypothetical protein
MESIYGTVAGLDVHKKTVVVVVLQSSQPDQGYAGGIFGTTHFGLKELAAFVQQHGVTHVAMESTAQLRLRELPACSAPRPPVSADAGLYARGMKI